MGTIGFIVMTAMLAAGAAYGMSSKGKPRPGVSSGQKKLLIGLGVLLVPCVLIMVLAVVYPPGH